MSEADIPLFKDDETRSAVKTEPKPGPTTEPKSDLKERLREQRKRDERKAKEPEEDSEAIAIIRQTRFLVHRLINQVMPGTDQRSVHRKLVQHRKRIDSFLSRHEEAVERRLGMRRRKKS